MIRHLFRLIWNQKRKNLGLSFEILFAFLVLFAVFSFVLYSYEQYSKPLGFDYENVWQVDLDWKDSSRETISIVQSQLKEHLKSYHEIEQITFTQGNTPFSGISIGSGMKHGNASLHSDIFDVDDNFSQTLNLEIIEGRWFNQEDDSNPHLPIVITEAIREYLFSTEPVIGKVINNYDDSKFQIVGVCRNYRYRSDFENHRYGFFRRQNDPRSAHRILLKVKDQATVEFETKLLSNLQEIASGWSIDIKYLSDQRNFQLNLWLVPMIVSGIICSFLIFNVALGLFGVLWQNISRRREEIGLRRAIGSTKREIAYLFVGESLVLATLSLILGVFFAVQFPVLNVFNVTTKVYLLAILLAMIIIYLLVFLCALFPSQQAAQLHPTVALHEE